MATFPKGWFFIKNQNNGYVLSTEKSSAGESVVIATMKSKDFDTQLWQYGEDERLHNKKTGFVLDIRKGLAKAGSDVVQQNESDSSECQKFALSSEGHIYLKKDQNLVLGIKESFFTRREGQHVHLQSFDKNIKDSKEQRWDFFSPSQKRSISSNNAIDSLKRTISGASLGSFSSSSTKTHDDDGCLDDSLLNQLSNFPDTEFFIKSDSTGYFVGVDAAAVNSPGARLSLEPLRKNNYESQLWHYDVITGRLINKNSGFTLSAEEVADESLVCQSSSTTDKDLPCQSWNLSDSGEIRLKHEQHSFVLGYKKDSWFGLNREGSPVLLQKQADGKTHSHQRFVVVLPVFKKKTTEIVNVTEQQGVFPEGYFFIKNQKHGLVISVLETDKLAAEIIASNLDTRNFNRQLWKHSDGFLINKASNLVLDVRGGCIEKGAELCQYKQKQTGFENQQWGLSVEGFIHAKTHKTMVLSIASRKDADSNVFLTNKKTPDHEEQRWNFVLPVFKQKSTTVTETTVKKSVSYHHYAQYPSGWFFIRSFIGGSSTDAPLVLTAESNSSHVVLSKINKQDWQYQLWMYWNGVLINFATQLAIDVVNDNINAGSVISQEVRKAGDVGQRWSLTVDGYLVHGSNPSLTLVPQVVEEGKYKLCLADHISSSHQDNRWGLLSPEVKIENNTQVLVRWSVTLLTEWKKTTEQTIQKVVHRIADWPQDTFFISAQDGLALAPEKSEAFSFVVVKKLELGQSEHFKWAYRNGYVVHVATGLVLHASDDLVGGSQLQIREELLADSKTIDQRQKWVIKTDGSIVSELKTTLGFALIQQSNQYMVQLAYTSNTSEHYSWGFVRGHYENRYSQVYKKEMSVVTRTERILLTVRTQHVSSNTNTKLVAHSYGVFPENWFYIRSKEDKTLVLTAPSRKEGAKLTLSKLDYKIFRRQLWHTQDNGCLVNLESDLVIDVAGGAFNIGSDIIQWHEKYLRRHRKNQLWGLSVDGHLHPKSRPGLVLGAKGNKVFDGAEVQLHARGALDLNYQQWTFATPIFGRTISGVKGVSAAGVLEENNDSVFIDSVDEASFKTSTTDRYERKTKLTVVRRWGLFPEGGFFIRAGYGDEHLALTVEKRSRTGEDNGVEHEVTLRPINFKEYQWHFWAYQEGHLINLQTGLALDARTTKGLLVEDGLRNPLFVREKSMSETQFWSLTAEGEIFLRSDQHLVLGVSNSRRVSVSGAQVGIRELRVRKFLNEKGQQETSIKSEKWLKWVFSKPVYRKTTTTTTTTTTSSTSVTAESAATAAVGDAGEIVEGLEDQQLGVKQKEESADDYTTDEDDDSNSDSGSDDDQESNSKKLNLIGNLGIATAGAGILAGTAGMITDVITSAPESISTAVIGKKTKEESSVKQSLAKKTSYKSLRNERKDSFHVSADYVPTGFEKVVRYKTHQQPNFPTAGYFMIKSHLHGYVFDIANGEAKDGAFVVLSPIRTTDFASQLWSYKDGRVFNLKGHNLVLDASMTDTITAGERLVISVQKSSLGLSDQYWEFGTEGGLICLKSKRNLVLGVKELKRATDQNASVDVYLQEEKSHLKSNVARPEQRWEIKVPAMIPVEQTTNTTTESKYTIIEGGKISAISSSVSAVIAFKWLKETFHHKVTANNQWPSSQNWFFIRIGNENAFLSSGSVDSSEVKFVSLGQNEDHKQFLWVYVNGYLVNYKYMLRLVYDKQSNKLLLSSDTKTLDQAFCVSSQGNLSVKIQSETTYFTVASAHFEHHSYELVSSTVENATTEAEHSLQLHVPVFSDVEVEKESKIALSTVTSWIESSQKTSSTATTTTTTTTTKVSQFYGVFPVGTWFFIKAQSKEGDSLVLAVKDSSSKSGASLILRKLNFKDYRSQLWTFRNGLLINYGSKLVIDVNGEINEYSKLIQSNEAGVSTQKWSLTADGYIQLDSYAQYTFGYTQVDTIAENIEVVLVAAKSYEASSTTQAICWRFSVPVFGKAASSTATTTTTTTTVTTTVSSIERITACIEQGALIESVEEADIKVEDISVKKNNAVNETSSSTTASVAKEKHHGFQDVLTSVGIAVTAGVVAVGAVQGASKVAEKISEHKQEKKAESSASSSSSTAAVVKQDQKQEASSTTTAATTTSNTVSAVTDSNKATETIVVRRSRRTSVQIIQESRSIIRAWKIVFSQRVHHCKTKEELVQTIEESRQELFRRLDEHLRVHASVDHLISGTVPEWHVSIQQVKELYRARVFDRFLDRLSHQEVTDVTSLDFDSTLSSATQEVENHYSLVIEHQTKILSESTSSTVQKTQQCQDVSIQEDILVTIDTIKVTVRYWFISLYETISTARNKGSSEEEIKVIIENSRKELTNELATIKASATGHIEKSSSTLLTSKQTSISNTIQTAITQTENTVNTQISTVCSEKKYLYAEEHWLDVTRVTEETLSGQLKVYQTAIVQEISEVQKTEVDKSDQAEISVVLDEKMVAVAQQTVANKLTETQIKLSSWYTEVTQQISWLLEESKTSPNGETVKQDTLAIVDAAQVEINTRIEETKLVVRAYYAHLTYLSWAERRRIEYALDSIKASLTASITQFKKSIEKSEVTNEDIVRYTSYSFGATASRIVLTDLQTIVVKVTNVKETTTIVNKSDEIQAEKTKIALTQGTAAAVTKEKVTEVTKTTAEQVEVTKKAESSKVDQVKKTEKVNVDQQTKIVDKIESEVEQTKVSKDDNNKQSSSNTTTVVDNSQKSSESGHGKAAVVSTAVIGAAAAAIAGAAIIHHHEGKATESKSEVAVNVPAVEQPVKASVIVGTKAEEEAIQVGKQTTASSTTTVSKQEKSETLVVVYDQVQVTVQEWITTLNKRVYECAQKKSSTTQQEIDTIVYESQQQLIVEIEKAKRNTTAVIGTSQTSFHDTLSWVRSTVWKQAVEVKRIGYEIASSTTTDTSTTHFQEKLETLKQTTLQKVDVEIEKSKKSASVIHVVGHEHAAVIAAGKKFEGVDYSKSSCGESIEKTKVTVGILIEDTRVTVQRLLRDLHLSITERRKQGGENVQADIDVIVKKHREEINAYIVKSKTEFEQRITSVHEASSTTTEVSSSVDVELTKETVKKVNKTLEQIQESVLVQVTKVEQVTTSTTITSQVEYEEKLTAITHEACQKLDATLAVSETVIGHHIEVIAESSAATKSSTSTTVTTEAETKESKQVSLGVEYGLLIVSETTKNVSSQISALIEQVHHRITLGSESLETDIHGYVTNSDKELDLIFEEAKTKISYELSMVASHEKVEEEHFIEHLESIRTSVKTRISQIQTVATTVHKEESKTVSEKLLQIAEESRHEVTAHYESIKQSIFKKTEKKTQAAHDSTAATQVVVSHTEEQKKQQEQKKQEEHKSSVDLAKKVLVGSAAVAAGTAIAVEVAKKLNEHKEKTAKIEHTEKETAIVVEDVKIQFNKWISTLTETVVIQSKQSQVSTEEISVTIEKSKAEFLEVIKKAKSSEVITEKHQHQVLTWIEETAVAQASRIQEIAVHSSTSSAIDIESKLQVIKISTSQEVDIALEKCKSTKYTVSEYVGVTVEQLKQKEAALLDIRSELAIVVQDVRSSLVTFFEKFSKSVVARLEQGGETIEKYLAILIANTRKELSIHVEAVKATATKRLSALETKSSTTVISTAALSGIATAEIIAVLKSSEQLLEQKINRVHSSVWYLEKNQDVTKIVETITTIQTETTVEITEKVESSHYGFVTAINDHHKAGHVSTDVIKHTTAAQAEHHEAVLKASLSVQEVKITIREWLRTLAEKVSVCSQKGGSSEEIDAIVQKENQVIFEYLDQSATKISESVKAEESIKHLHTTVEQVKATITKTSTEIKVIGVEASTTTSHSYGGFDKMTSVITQHEHQISEALVVYEQKITKQTSESTTTSSSEAAKKTTTAVSKKDTYTVVAVEYILSTVQTWMQELMVEVSECAKVEHNVQIATKMINSIVTEYREYINVEFAMITERIQSSKSDATARQELINMLEWTRGVILQSSTQVQSIGINCASSFSATGGIEQMKPLVNASWDQVKLTVERCNKAIKIDVERTSAHSEKKKVKSDCQKQEIQKKAECLAAEKKKKEEACAKKASKKDSDSSDSDSGSDSDTKKKQKKAKKDCAKKKGKSTAGKKKAQKSPDSDSSDDDSASDSERNDNKKKKKVAVGIIAGGVAGAIIKAKHDDSDSDSESDSGSGSDTDSNSGSSSGSDSDGSKKTTVVDKKKLSTGEATLDVTVIVREWYEKLIVDVSNRSKKGGSSASADIEIIVQKATKSITETLRIISVNAHKSVSDKTTVTQYQASIEWAKNLVIQSSYTIKAIGINTAASASSKTGGIEQMRPIAVSIQEQINVEIRRYKLVVQQIEQVAKKDTAVSVIEHKQNNEKICTGRQSAVNRKDYCDKLEKHVSEVVAESKVVIVSWFAQLIREVSIRVHQGGPNVEQDVAALIVKAKLELSSTIERTKNKLSSSIEVYEKDKTFALVEYHIHESLKTVQTTVDSKITQVQEIVTKHHSESEVTEKLSVVLEASKVDITETLESTHTQSVTVIKQETTQTESTVKIIDTVDTVKTAVAHWHTKLSEEIHAISIDTTTTITEKEQRISTLIQEATVEIQRVTVEAKSTVTLESSSVKKISKSKEQELLATIDYVHETFAANVKKIQEVSIEAVSKAETTNIKESISTVIRTSHEKIDTALTRTTATVIGAATAAIAVHAASKQDKKQQETKSSQGKLSVDVDENVTVISKWFELFTKRVSGSVVHKTDESVDVVQNVTAVTEHAEQEITEIISTARNDFVKRLSLQNLDQESYNYACKHYEESLESVRVSIVTQIVEVKKVAIHAHTTGNVQELEAKLTKLSETSNERIKIAMGSSVVISHKAQSGAPSSCGKQAEAVVQIKVKEDDAIVVGDQDIEFGRKESTTTTTTSNSQEKTKKSEKAEEKKKDSNIDKIVAGTLAIGAAAGAAVLINKKNEKEDVVSKTQDLKYDSGITTIDSVNISISAWFTSLIQKVSMASRVGASSKKITSIVQESRNELTQIIEHAKVTGGKYCASASDEQQFISKIEWASSVAHNQAEQIQQIGINSSGGKADMTGQMQALATASYHQIEVTLEQLKTSVTFHQKINKINTSKTQQTADTSKTEKTTSAVEKPVCGNMATSVDKTKVAYTVIQETRATTIAMFVSLSERIVIRIRQGGSNVQEDVNKMIASSEQEVTKIFAEAKSTSSKVDKKTRLEIEQALSSVHKTVQEEITQVKVVTTEVVSSETTDTKVAVEKVLQVSKTSKSKIETTFTSVSESIAASLIIVSQTAQQATETVQGWFSDLKNKIDKLLEAGDCSEEETQQKINVVVAEAEVEMKAKIEKLQQTATTTTTSTKKTTTQVTTDHHLDIFFGNIKSSVQSQLDVVKTAVQDTSKTDKSKIMSAIETSETKLQQEVKNHYEAVEKITTVEHITGSKQQETTAAAGAQVEKQDRHDSYKDTIVKTAVGSAAVAAAAAIAIDYHKKNQQAETTAVQVVNKASIQDVQVQIDTWFTRLSQKVTACTKKGGSNVSVEVDKIVKEAQAELEVTINQAKTQHTATTTTTTTTSESSRTFVSTLEWIKVTAYSQSTQITQIVSQGSSSSIDLTTQIENHVSATKQQVDSALEVHYNKKESTSSTVVSENIVQVVKESRQQTQKRFSLETTVIVQESKTHITNWLVLLLENITSIIHGNSETIRKDIFARLDVAEKELDVFIKQTKDKFLLTSNTSATSHVETETQTLVVNSVKQTLDCIDSIKATLLVQISVLREVINRIEVEDIDVITERLEAVITRTQKRVHHTLEVGVDLAISSAFEGKVVTWSETLQIPASFKDVRVIAFDVLGTVANYRKNLYQVWKQVTAPKNDLVLASFDFDVLVREWYGAYIEIKRENFAKKRPVSDDISLHESLVHILKRYYLKDTLSEAEIEQLCAAWQTIGVYDDASIGIRRLKNQVSAKYATIAISDTLSTRSLIDLAQSNCLCWHGQFTAEMFASQQQNATASQSVVKGTIELLGLERASQLAIVSSSSELIAAAKKEGCHTVLIEREECCAAASSSAHKEAVVVNEVDIKVDGLDVFGESVQSFLEHESMVQVWNEKGAPAAPRVLVQQLKRSSSN